MGWAAVPRVGDTVEIGVDHPADGEEWYVAEVSWRIDGSTRVELVYLWDDADPESSTRLAVVTGHAKAYGGGQVVPNPTDRRNNPDRGVRFVVNVLELLQQHVLYEWLAKLTWLRRPELAYLYVAAWSLALALVLALSEGWTGTVWAWLLIIALPIWRLADIVRWYVDLFIDRAHDHLMSPERNLIFVVLNLAEITLIAAIWFHAAGQPSDAWGALFAAFTTVTQIQAANVSGTWASLAFVAIEIASLTALLAGIAALVSEVQEKLRSTGKWRGEPM